MTAENQVEPEPKEQEEGEPRRKSVKDWLRSRRVLGGLVLLLALGGAGWWWYERQWESTDDAQVDGNINPVSARVTGHVARVNFEENQMVRAGTLLVEIDATDYRVALEKARAAYVAAQAAADAARENVPIITAASGSQLSTARAGVNQARAGVTAASKRLDAAEAAQREAKANDVRAQADLVRYRHLLASGVVSRQQYDQAVAMAKTTAATVDAARATAVALRQEVKQSREKVAAAQAELRSAETAPSQVAAAQARAESAAAAVKTARAAMDQAELNLRYTRVLAPVDGITGRKTVEVGQNVQPGQVLLYLVPVNDLWVTANFKETQLRLMRPGQKAVVHVDAYDRDYQGHVESMGGASGARFSLFPPENATGNYVKVVQRLPVRIRFDPGQEPGRFLRPGMSVEPKVQVR